MEKLGRNREHMKILPACFVVVGDTVEEAKAKRAKLDSLVELRQLDRLAVDRARQRRLEIRSRRTAAGDSRKQRLARAAASAPSPRPSARTSPCASSRSAWAAIPGLAMVGTPKTIADEMEEWIETNASDGFTIMFPYLPGGLDDFVSGVIPELQRRGLFRREYEGKTLRENLGPAAAGEPLLRSQQGRGGRIT